MKATSIAIFATSFATVRSSFNTVLHQFQHNETIKIEIDAAEYLQVFRDPEPEPSSNP